MALSELRPVPNSHYAPGRELETPYLRARQEWDRYVGDVMVRERRWRFAFSTVSGIAALLIAGLVYLGGKPKLIPYVVRVDRLGSAAYAGRLSADATSLKATPAEIKAHILRWLDDVRSISTDIRVLQKNWKEAFTFSSAVAANQLTAYAKEHEPATRAAEGRVTIELQAIVQIGDDRWQADWTEIGWDKSGAQTDVAHWRAALRIIQRPAQQTFEEIEPNPLGLLVDQFSWTKVQS